MEACFAEELARENAKRTNSGGFRLLAMDSTACYLVALLPLLSLGYCFSFRVTWPGASVFDLFSMAYSASNGLPLIWFVCPLITMLVLSRLWKLRLRCDVAVRGGSRSRMWLACIGDVLVASFACAAVVHLSLLVEGFALLGVPCDVGDPASLFAYYTGGQTLGEFSFGGALALMLLYAVLVLIVSNGLFFLLFCLANPTLAFFVVAFLAYPAVHKTHSFVHDVVSTYGGDLLAVNPLSYLYETASVFYPTWLPGSSHSLWFLVLVAVFFFLCALPLMRKKEF